MKPHEVKALFLLTLGAILLPIVGWVWGASLAWRSTTWSTTDKTIGILIWPVFMFVPGTLFVINADHLHSSVWGGTWPIVAVSAFCVGAALWLGYRGRWQRGRAISS